MGWWNKKIIDMAENFDSLSTLLQLVQPGLTPDELYALASQPNQAEWQALIAEAELQDVAPFLYTLLLDLSKSHGLEIPQKERLHQAYLSTAARNMLALHDTEIILNALQEAGLPAAGLKGIYLLEQVYPTIAARSMSDIDILIKKQDLAACIRLMKNLGYIPDTYFNLEDENLDIKHLPPMMKPGSPAVEAHWTLLEEHEPFTIDIEALWERMLAAKIANVEVLSLGVEDLVLHLCLHLTYQHYLQLGLRSLLDIALVLHKYREEIDWDKLVQIANTWGAERVTALTLKLLESHLNAAIPQEVYPALMPEGIESALLEQARRQLLERERFADRFTPVLLELSANKGLFSKIKIGLQRVFLPRLTLARLYNVPPDSPKIAGLYFVRLKYLVRNYGRTLLRLQSGADGVETARQKAEISNSLHSWLTQHREDN